MGNRERSLVNEIYEAAVIPERWPQVLDRISKLAGSLGGFMIAVTPGSEYWMATERMRPTFEDWFAEGWQAQNIWAEKVIQHNPVGFFDETDIFAPGETNTIPMYTDFVFPRGFGWSTTAHMQIPTGDRVDFRFDRRLQDGPMEMAERISLNHLRPHLARAAFLFTRLGIQQARSMVEALNDIDIPAAVLTNTGRLLACNAFMEARLSQLRVGSGGHLAFNDGQAQAALSDGLSKISAGLFNQLRGPIPVPATEEHAASIAYLIPMQATAQDVFGGETSLLLLRPAQPENRLLDLVRVRFAVDTREAQRITRLIGSYTPRLAAALLTSTATFDVVLDRVLGTARTRREAKMAAFLAQVGAEADPRAADGALSWPRVADA